MVASRQDVETWRTIRAVRRTALIVLAAVLSVAASGCTGSSGDKAGGQRTVGKPVVLTLAQHDAGYGGDQFAAAIAERSGGSIRIAVRSEWQGPADFERSIVDDVRMGKADLGVVAVRAWDTLGVTSFRGLIAPFLVDSLELERRVLESPLAARMLAGVERAGVVGVAVLPGPLRRAFGYRRALVGPDDYRGAKIGVRPGRVEESTFRSLGANTRVYLSLHGASREGAALHLSDITHYGGRTLATNVVFWPRTETVVMNRQAFAKLTAAQQEVLRAAARQAVGLRITEIDRGEKDALRSICEGKLASLVTASPEQIAALHAAVRPVYAQLERDAETRNLIARIRKLQAGSQSEPLRCPEAETGVAFELEGRWQATPSRAELLSAGATSRELAGALSGLEIEFADGEWNARGLHTRRAWTGTYTVTGDVVRATLETCSHNPCAPGASTEHAWSVYRDTLSLTPRVGRSSWPLLTAKPFTQAR